MKKETAVIILIITFIAGFIVGAVSSIKFYASMKGSDHVAQPGPATGGGGAPQVNPQEIARLEAVVKSEPTNAQALVALGNIYFDTNQYRKSIEMYERSLAVNPNNPDVRTDLGVMYRAVKEFDKALKEFRESARLDQSHKTSRFNLGIVLQYDKKDVPGAIGAWEDFLKLEPSGERAESVRREIEKLRNLGK